MKLLYTKDTEWLKKWDDFLITEKKASHLLLTDWVSSYHSYGFDYDFCICIDSDKIVGGYSAIIAKASIFKFLIVPHGPIVSDGYEKFITEIIASVVARAKFHNACYCQITIPHSAVANPHVYNQTLDLQGINHIQKGHLFKYVYSSFGLGWIDLVNFNEETKIMSLKTAVRRNIRNSYRKDLVLTNMDSNERLEEGYRLFTENSKAANYSIREWEDIKESLYALLEKGYLKMIGAYKNEELKGAILLIKSGGYYTYILGGSKKEVPDLRTGDFLQWEAIKLSLESGYDGYNISLGGSKGVTDFKNSFNTEQILYENSNYHWVLKPFVFKFYLLLEKYLMPNKKKISKILSFFKNKG